MLDPMIITFAIYILGMLLIGFIAYAYTKNLSDYILGGRRLGSMVTGLSAGASDMSGWLLMGLPGAVYAMGIVESWIAIGLTAGAYLNWLLVAGRLRVFTEINANALTLPEYLHARFQDKTHILKIASASIILLFFSIYCASGVRAGAIVFTNLFDIPYHQALWYGALATIAYTFIGGFLAVSWTDSIQAGLMVFALIFTPIFVFIHLGGYEMTLNSIHSLSASEGHNFLDLWTGTTFIGLLSLAAWGLGYFGQPHILTRFMAAESARSIRGARRIGMSWMIFCLAGAVAIGLFGRVFFFNHPELAEVVNKDREQVFIELAKLLFNPWLAGVLLSAILAAVMSTLSCQLLICSSAIAEDFYKGMLRPKASDKELVWIGRAMVLLVAIIAIAIAQDPNRRVLELVSGAWAGFGCAFGPVVLFSLFWKRMTTSGALAGMITGALVVMYWHSIFKNSALYEMIPGFILASLAIIIVSLISKAPTNSVLKQFERATNAYRQEK